MTEAIAVDVCGGPGPAAVDDLAAEIVGFAGRLSAAMCQWLLLIARLDTAEGCRWLGFHSTSPWLAYACGLSKRTADDHVRAARALAAFPALAVSMSAGRVSYSHVRAISRLVQPGEAQLVDDLIVVAEHGTVAHLEVIVRGLQTVDDISHRDDGWVPEDYVRQSWTQDARWRLSARLDPDQGAVIGAAVKAVAAAEGIGEVQALVRIAELALVHVNDKADGKRAELRGEEQSAVVISLDGSRIGSAEPNAERSPRPYARILNGPGLPDRVVKRLLCAGRIRTVVRGDGASVLDLGRSHRVVSAKLWRALLIRDRGHCSKPGCYNSKALQAHHVVHWLDGGRTDLANLTLLCQADHLGHHNGEFAVTANGSGEFVFTRPDGTDLTRPAASRPIPPDPWLRAQRGDAKADAATTRWDGSLLQRDYAISVLAEPRDRCLA